MLEGDVLLHVFEEKEKKKRKKKRDFFFFDVIIYIVNFYAESESILAAA